MNKELNEVVRVYEDCLNPDGLGDFVRCADCGELQLICENVKVYYRKIKRLKTANR